MDVKGKGKAGYKRLPKDPFASPGSDMELPTLQGSTSSFPTRYLQDNVRLDNEQMGEDDEDGGLYHEKQWPANRRVWKKRWCEWRIIMLIVLGSLVLGVLVIAITTAPKTADKPPISVHPVTFGSDLSCAAPHFFNDPRNAEHTVDNTTFVAVPVPGAEFTITTVGWIATGIITLSWDRTLSASRAEMAVSIASQDPTFDFTMDIKRPQGGIYLEVYDEANDMNNCVVYNLTLRLPWAVTTLNLDMGSRGQVRVLPPATVLDDGSSTRQDAHILQQFNAAFTTNRTGSVLLLSQELQAEKARIVMIKGEVTGSWPMPKGLTLSLGPDVSIGAGLEFFPFEG